jgi:hypothetical protein
VSEQGARRGHPLEVGDGPRAGEDEDDVAVADEHLVALEALGLEVERRALLEQALELLPLPGADLGDH